jgi:hypothetical protein
VLDGVLKRFLDDPVEAQREIVRKRRRQVLVRDCDGNARLRELALQAVQRGHQANEPQLGGMQAERQVAHAPGNALDSAQRVAGQASGSFLRACAQQFEIHGQHGHLLTDVVVQVSSNPRTLVILRMQQPPAQIADSVVAPPQLVLFLQQPLFRLLPSRSLNQQPGDERHLNEQQQNRAHDVKAVPIPDRRLPEPDAHVSGDSRVADAPTPQLPPVDLPHVQIRRNHRDAFGLLAS